MDGFVDTLILGLHVVGQMGIVLIYLVGYVVPEMQGLLAHYFLALHHPMQVTRTRFMLVSTRLFALFGEIDFSPSTLANRFFVEGNWFLNIHRLMFVHILASLVPCHLNFSLNIFLVIFLTDVDF